MASDKSPEKSSAATFWFLIAAVVTTIVLVGVFTS